MDAVQALARGEMPPPMERDCIGECAQLRDGLNRAIGTIAALVEAVQRLAHAAREGRLDVRIDPSLHQGEFRRVAEGLNATLDGAWTPAGADWLTVSPFLAFSSNYVNPAYATNMVTNGQGFSPVVLASPT